MTLLDHQKLTAAFAVLLALSSPSFAQQESALQQLKSAAPEISAPSTAAVAAVPRAAAAGLDFSEAVLMDARLGTAIATATIDDLEAVSGLSLRLDAAGRLVCARDDAGTALVLTGPDAAPRGSAVGRGIILAAIDGPNRVVVMAQPRRPSAFFVWEGGEYINLNLRQIGRFIAGTSPELEPRTLGYGMVFLHELLHSSAGGGLRDNHDDFGVLGSVEAKLNLVRAQLGARWGQRLSYKPMRIDGKDFLPFDQRSLDWMLGDDYHLFRIDGARYIAGEDG